MQHLKRINFAVFILIALQACSDSPSGNNSTASKAVEEIARANGVEEFKKVKSLEFTFNVDKDSNHAARHWKWLPADNQVVYYENNDSTVFKRMDTSTAQLKKLNAQFTNDEYWLVFPLHLEWDKGYSLSGGDTSTGLISGKQLRTYNIQYNDKDGFTPGDLYKIFVDDTNMIQEWAYHKSGSDEPSLVASWENYEDFNGLKIAKEHRTRDGKFRLYFTGVTVSH